MVESVDDAPRSIEHHIVSIDSAPSTTDRDGLYLWVAGGELVPGDGSSWNGSVIAHVDAARGLQK